MRLTDDVISAPCRASGQALSGRAGGQTRPLHRVALADPSDLDAVDTLQRMLNADMELRVATDEDIDERAQQVLRGGGRFGGADDPGHHGGGSGNRSAAPRGGSGRWSDGGGRRADHQAGQHVDRGGVQGAGVGHPFGTAGQDLPCALPDRRRAARDEKPAQAVAGGHHQPAQNPVQHVHRRTAHPAGRPHSDPGGRQAHRLARLVHPDQSRGKHRHAHSGQGRAAAGACRSWDFSPTTSRPSSG